MILILQNNGPYKKDSKDGKQNVEREHNNNRGIRIERKNQDALAKDIIVTLTPELISDMSQHKR